GIIRHRRTAIRQKRRGRRFDSSLQGTDLIAWTMLSVRDVAAGNSSDENQTQP
ncbi:unnamed protein product, partial [Ectocarpus sp. 12 AP-2014]